MGWNRGAELMFGYTEAGISGQSGAQLVSQEYRNRYFGGIEGMPAAEASIIGKTSELVGVRRDGSRFPLELSPSEWETEEGQFYTAIIRDISVRKQAEEDLREQLAELVALQTVSAAMRTAQTVDELLPRLLDETLVALNTEAGVIWLSNQARDELRVSVARNWFGQLEEPPMKPGEGIAGTVFATGQPHISAEFARDPLAKVSGLGAVPPGWGGACVAIRTASEALGVLFVSVPHPRQVSSGQVKLLVSLAEMGGTAIQRMRLHEETVKRLEQLQALHAVDQGIAASLDLRLTLNILLEKVVSQLRVDAADVLLIRRELERTRIRRRARFSHT